MNIKKLALYGVSLTTVAAVSVLGTLAYLTDRDSVANTFTVGKVDITLDEMDVTPDGVPVTPPARVKGNEYHLIPGQTYVKDPTMTIVAGSEESYVRMLVTITNYDALQTIYDGAFLPQNFVEGWDPEIWISTEEVTVSDNGKEATYEFRYKETVDGKNDQTGDAENQILPALFETFTVPGFFDGDDLKALENLQITVVGHAIQAATFEAVVDDAGNEKTAEDVAWEAFDLQNTENTVTP